jgi:tetratricopeptide (TPR) repeat protein
MVRQGRRVSVKKVLAVSIALLSSVTSGYGQSQPAPQPPVNNPALPNLEARLSANEKLLDLLTERISSQAKVEDSRFDALNATVNRLFNTFTIMGASATCVVAIIALLSYLAGKKKDESQRQDYERERKFYEDNVKDGRKFYEDCVRDYESRQTESHQLAVTLARKTAANENTASLQQIALTDNFLKRSEEVLSKQIDGMVKLGGVIELVKRTFEMQLTRVGDVDTLSRRVERALGQISVLTDHFRRQYDLVCNLMMGFKGHSRIAWTRLTPQEEVAATRALTTFETIPESVVESILTEDGGKNRYRMAFIYQLLGVSAYYTNDVDAAMRNLEKALKIYGEQDAPAEYLFSQAFCSHFLGVAEKNWCHLDRPPEANLSSAKKHLEDAARRLSTKEGEFLTPITLAEVLSYSEQNRAAAKAELDKIISRFESLKERDENQKALFARACLLRGDIEYLNKDLLSACEWYQRSSQINPQSAYAVLSLAQSTPSSDGRSSDFKRGLELLEGSTGPLSKRETSVRLTAVAWAIIAAHDIGDTAKRERYLRELDAAKSSVRPVGGRALLFFCPITKTQVMLQQLQEVILETVSQREPNRS